MRYVPCGNDVYGCGHRIGRMSVLRMNDGKGMTLEEWMAEVSIVRVRVQ
jgi:hypothetical protein